MDNNNQSSSHAVFNIKLHIVFVTKYRRKTLTPELLEYLKSAFADCLAAWRCSLVEFGGEPDHVHLLIEYPPTVELSRLINSLKGVSSRLIRRDFPELKRRVWKGKHLWSPSYFAASCGGAPLSIIRQYVESQRTPGT